MTIYRLTFTTDLLIDCDNEEQAVHLGYKNLMYEVRNNTSDLTHIQKIESISQIRRHEKNSLPWRDSSRRDEPEKTVNQILENT